mmetsp:Transcript_44904/g.124870  ORF Transcript_44904/g.124870 Transcript_44904/m.124870 type:complete len:307 (-) Transcript_44904:136-1056(-)
MGTPCSQSSGWAQRARSRAARAARPRARALAARPWPACSARAAAPARAPAPPPPMAPHFGQPLQGRPSTPMPPWPGPSAKETGVKSAGSAAFARQVRSKEDTGTLLLLMSFAWPLVSLASASLFASPLEDETCLLQPDPSGCEISEPKASMSFDFGGSWRSAVLHLFKRFVVNLRAMGRATSVSARVLQTMTKDAPPVSGASATRHARSSWVSLLRRCSLGVFIVEAFRSNRSLWSIERCIWTPSKSLGSVPKGFSSSVAMKFRDHKMKTCMKEKIPAQKALLHHWDTIKGTSSQCMSKRELQVCV